MPIEVQLLVKCELLKPEADSLAPSVPQVLRHDAGDDLCVRVEHGDGSD